MTKTELRAHVWEAIRVAGAGRFPGIVGRIPNFVGAETAARRLVETDRWREVRVLKANPDSPETALRRAALTAGKVVYMAVPRLAEEKPFLELDPARLGDVARRAASIKGAFAHGRPVGLDEMRPIDLIVTGCVGVTRAGARLGKGGGYSDLEYGLLREAGLVDADTPIVTVVHPSQVLADGAIPVEPHDISLDAFATPDEVVECARVFERPSGILWEVLEDEKRDAIPVLAGRGRA